MLQCESQPISSYLGAGVAYLEQSRGAVKSVTGGGNAEARAHWPLHTAHKSSPLCHKSRYQSRSGHWQSPTAQIGFLKLFLQMAPWPLVSSKKLWNYSTRHPGHQTDNPSSPVKWKPIFASSRGPRTNIQQYSGGHNGKTQLCVLEVVLSHCLDQKVSNIELRGQ